MIEQLQMAQNSRVLIEQAKGTLAERHGIAVDDAFEQLRSCARDHGERLTDVAGKVMQGALDPVTS